MRNAPTKEHLSKIPKLYETEHTPFMEKIIHAHCFICSCDWFIAECDEAGNICYGFAILNGDHPNAGWCFFALSELKAIRKDGIEVDFDLAWTPCQAIEVRSICKANGWVIHQPGKYMANMTA